MEIRSASAASFVLLLLSLSSFLCAGAQLLSWQCYSGANYKENSTYQFNVRSLLSSLAANASRSQSLFATAVVGASTDTVWGLGLCRRDITNGAECASCLDLAPQVAFGNRDYCKGVKDVSIFYDRCIIRYSHQNFLTSPDNRQVQSRGASNVSVVPHEEADRYDALVVSLAVAVADSAAFNTTSRYATGVMVSDQGFTTNTSNEVVHTIYGLVQCTLDQAPGPCRECLQGLIDGMKFNGQRRTEYLGHMVQPQVRKASLLRRQPHAEPHRPSTDTTFFSPPVYYNRRDKVATTRRNGIHHFSCRRSYPPVHNCSLPVEKQGYNTTL